MGYSKTQDEHKLKTIYSDGPGTRDLLILAHIDIDGAISAYFLATALRQQYHNVYVVFTKPYTSLQLRKFLVTKKHQLENCETALVDVSINQMSPGTTAYLLEFLIDHLNLKYIIDHHVGWPEFLRYNNIKGFTVLQGAAVKAPADENVAVFGNNKACAELVYRYFRLDVDDDYLANLLTLAEISDDLGIRGAYEGSEQYQQFMGLKSDDMYHLLDRFLTKDLSTDTTWYEEKTSEVKEYLGRAKEVYPGIGYIQLLNDSAVNRTLLCEQGYKKYKVFIISEINSHKMKITYTIATALDDVNLVDMFALRSGSPRKISVCKKHITVDYIVNKFKPLLKEEAHV